MQSTRAPVASHAPNTRSSESRRTVSRMSTILQGNAAEAAALQAFAAAGFHVLVPFGGGLPVRRGCVEFNTEVSVEPVTTRFRHG
jgi:hypothetical protein